MRGFSNPISIQNVSNDIDDKTIEVMLKVCKKNAPIFQKYFKQKAKRVGVKKLRRYDLYAPSKKSADEKEIIHLIRVQRLVLNSLNIGLVQRLQSMLHVFLMRIILIIQ